jgi:Mor family transcriptional regulator
VGQRTVKTATDGVRFDYQWSPEQVAEMKERHDDGETYNEIAATYGCSGPRIGQLICRRYGRQRKEKGPP